MNGLTGWIVAVVVVLAAGIFYFWPQIMKAPSATDGAQQASQTQPTQQADMPGTWRSDKDAKFTREIRADGVIIDRYEGEPSAGTNGQWSAVADVAAEGLSVPPSALAGKTVIKVVWEGGVETTYFAVDLLTDASMTTTDLSGRGEVNMWTRL